MPGSIIGEYRGDFVVGADDGGELLAKLCGILGSVAIFVYVVAGDVAWVHDLNGASDQVDGMSEALAWIVALGLQRVEVPRQGVRGADVSGSW